MKLIGLLTLLSCLSFSSFAKDCTYKINSKDIKVKWTAFKTPLKKGVAGKFNELGIKRSFKGKTLTKALEGVEFNIDTTSVDTNNNDRDKKIAKFFFGKMDGVQQIQGKIISLAKKVLILEIQMNNTSKTVPMSFHKTSKGFKANGHIDILDFSMMESLKGINNACFKLHQGKTWSDVAIKLEASYSKDC